MANLVAVILAAGKVVGMAFLMDTATPERKLVDNYISFFTLQHADEENQCVKVELSQN